MKPSGGPADSATSTPSDARPSPTLPRRLARPASACLGLPLWSGSIEDLIRLKIPMVATLDRNERDLGEADEAADRARSAVDQAEAEASGLDVEIARFRLEGDVPSLEDLAARRLDRDLAWQAVRGPWIAGDRPLDASTIADRFESRVIEADATADRLRLEADRVARQARDARGPS